MSAYRKADIRELAKAAYRLDGKSIDGILHKNPETGEWYVGEKSLDSWLTVLEDQDITLLGFSMEQDTPSVKRVCRTCGREYTGYECSHCRDVRIRLRGR